MEKFQRRVSFSLLLRLRLRRTEQIEKGRYF
jgi:hypothetical protein